MRIYIRHRTGWKKTRGRDNNNNQQKHSKKKRVIGEEEERKKLGKYKREKERKKQQPCWLWFQTTRRGYTARASSQCNAAHTTDYPAPNTHKNQQVSTPSIFFFVFFILWLLPIHSPIYLFLYVDSASLQHFSGALKELFIGVFAFPMAVCDPLLCKTSFQSTARISLWRRLNFACRHSLIII